MEIATTFVVSYPGLIFCSLLFQFTRLLGARVTSCTAGGPPSFASTIRQRRKPWCLTLHATSLSQTSSEMNDQMSTTERVSERERERASAGEPYLLRVSTYRPYYYRKTFGQSIIFLTRHQHCHHYIHRHIQSWWRFSSSLPSSLSFPFIVISIVFIVDDSSSSSLSSLSSSHCHRHWQQLIGVTIIIVIMFHHHHRHCCHHHRRYHHHPSSTFRCKIITLPMTLLLYPRMRMQEVVASCKVGKDSGQSLERVAQSVDYHI